MVFHNEIDKLAFSNQQQTALDMLRNIMILINITSIEHDICFVVTPFSTINPIFHCSDTKTISNCEPQ